MDRSRMVEVSEAWELPRLYHSPHPPSSGSFLKSRKRVGQEGETYQTLCYTLQLSRALRCAIVDVGDLVLRL